MHSAIMVLIVVGGCDGHIYGDISEAAEEGREAALAKLVLENSLDLKGVKNDSCVGGMESNQTSGRGKSCWKKAQLLHTGKSDLTPETHRDLVLVEPSFIAGFVLEGLSYRSQG